MEKTTSSANRLVLKRILSQEGNNRCADCKTSTHPRWASWNIGVLICIRCSGIHRSLGTHISKVRSIDLDTWNDQQLEKLVEFGNIRANAYWESRLPPNYVPDESKMPSFIKTKYELKRWVPADGQVCSTSAPPEVPPKIRPGLVQSSTNRGSEPMVTPSRSSPTTAASVDLLSLDSFTARPTKSTAGGTSHPQVSQPVQPHPPTNSAHKDRADVKRSILSLYSQPITPSPVSRANSQTPQSSQPSQPTYQPIHQSNHQPIQVHQPIQPIQPMSTTASASTGNSQLDFDEDNFASVWK